MADTPITGLPLATSVSSSDVLPIVQGGVTRQATAAQIVDARERRGRIDDVLCDGTASTPVTFPIPFVDEIEGVTVEVFNYSGSDSPFVALSHHLIGIPTTEGFEVVIGGGDPGDTCSIYYRASGS